MERKRLFRWLQLSVILIVTWVSLGAIMAAILPPDGCRPVRDKIIVGVAAKPQVRLGETVYVEAIAEKTSITTDCNMAGEQLPFTLSLVQKPSGSNATLDESQPFFVPDVEGSYTVRINASVRPGETKTDETVIEAFHPDKVNDLAITGLEVTQGVSEVTPCGSSVRLPLVAGKRTIVRVHVRSEAGKPPVSGVSAKLRGTNLVPLWLYPANPSVNQPIVGAIEIKDNPDRAQLGDSFWFVLPDDPKDGSRNWIKKGTLELTAYLGQSPMVDDNRFNNWCKVWVTFHDTDPLRIVPIQVAYSNPFRGLAGTPSIDDYKRTMDYLWKTYPIKTQRGGIVWHLRTIPVMPFVVVAQLVDFSNPLGWLELLIRLYVRNLSTIECFPDTNCKWYALVPREAPQGFPDGMALALPSGLLNWFLRFSEESAGRFPDGDAERAGRIMAHELGHNFGRWHAGDGWGESDGFPWGWGVDDDYPDPTGRLVPPSQCPAGFFGFDTFTAKVIDPCDPTHVPHDFMSYGPNPWISAYTYCKLLEEFDGPKCPAQLWSTSTIYQASLQEPETPACPGLETEEYLVVTGIVFSKEGKTDWDDLPELELKSRPFYRLRLPLSPVDEVDFSLLDSAGPKGTHRIELLDADGKVLCTRNVSLAVPPEDSTPPPGSPPGWDATALIEVLPYDPRTKFILLWDRDEVISERYVTANSPEVKVIFPNGGESLGETHEVIWEAQDADPNDLLTYNVLYSGDGGQTWILVAQDLKEADVGRSPAKFELDTTQLPGGNRSIIRVIATDGVNTGQDDSDAFFSVSRKAPQAFIMWPPDNSEFALGSTVRLEGQAYDQEDGVLDDNALSWSSDRDGELGSSSAIETAELSPGRHVITLTARDKDRPPKTGTDSVTIVVQPPLPPQPKVILTVDAAQWVDETTLILIKDIPVSITLPLRTIEAKSPVSLPVNQGISVAVEVPNEVQVEGQTFVFIEWSLDDTDTFPERVVSTTLENNTSLIAIYQPKPQTTVFINAVIEGLTVPIPVSVTMTYLLPPGTPPCTTPNCVLTVNPGTRVVVRAPLEPSVGGRSLRLQGWRVDGGPLNNQNPFDITISRDTTLTALYQQIQVVTLTIIAQQETGQEIRGVPITINTPPLGTLTTPFSFPVELGGRVELVAPQTVGNLQFKHWFSVTDNRVLTSNPTLSGTADKTETLAAVYRAQVEGVTLNIVSICEGCATGPVQFSGAQIQVVNPPLGTRFTPFSLQLNLRDRVTLIAASTASAGGRTLQFSHWFSITDNRVLTTNPTLDGRVDKSETLAAVYRVQAQPTVFLTVQAVCCLGNPTTEMNVPIQIELPIGTPSPQITPFTLSLNPGTTVRLVAPENHGGAVFVRWELSDGTILTTDRTLQITVNSNLTVRALFNFTASE